jgi:hypothetical protein
MIAIIPRREFEEDLVDVGSLQAPSKEANQWNGDMVRATGSIPVEYNERLKAMARKQGKTADQLIGELLLEMRPVLDQWEARQEAVRLRERFGPDWMQLLQEVTA